MVFVALGALLLALLTIGYVIDLPTTQASVARTQSALDIGAVHGLYTHWSYNSSAETTFNNAYQVLEGSYNSGASSAGKYSSGFAGAENAHLVVMPALGRGSDSNDLSKFRGYTCVPGTGGNCTEIADLATSPVIDRVRPALLQVYDSGNVDDFRNSVLIYSRIRPYHYLGFLPERDTETISASRLKNVMTHVIVDPAFSMGTDNYGFGLGVQTSHRFIFGDVAGESDGATDTLMWPLAGFRARAGGGDVIFPRPTADGSAPSTAWGSSWPPLNLLEKDPALPAGYNDRSGTQALALAPKVAKFYAESCDSLPFFYFKAGAVNLLDRFANSSAFSSTTLVSVMGYRHDDALLPITPTDYSGAVPSLATDFPLATSSVDSSQKFLHTGREEFFSGFVNSSDPRTSVSGGALPPGGINRWELLYCRGLYGDGPVMDATTVGFKLPEDLTGNTEEAALNHIGENKRSRTTGVCGTPNWVDDDAVSTFVMEHGCSQSGLSPSDKKETPRNAIGSLAIRLKNNRVESALSTNLASVAPTPIPFPQRNSDDALTGWRYTPSALREACLDLDTSGSSYNGSNSSFSRLRPIDEDAVVFFGFGIYTLQALSSSGSPAADSTGAFNDFFSALQTCLCGKPQRKLFFGFLPMDAEDRGQVAGATQKIQEFEDSSNLKCLGVTPFSDPCGGQESGSVFTFVYDPNDPRFASSYAGGAQINAAEAYSQEVYDVISKLLVEYVYPL